jgi:hypothetical protein
MGAAGRRIVPCTNAGPRITTTLSTCVAAPGKQLEEVRAEDGWSSPGAR